MTSLIVAQALLNVFAVLGLAPLTGVPLPFISYGSTNLLVMLAAMGLLLNVAAGGNAHVQSVPAARGRDDDGAVGRMGRWSGAPRIVIAAGGTAGHVVPALAVAAALRAEGASVTFIGGERAEAELVPAAGFELHTISVEGMSRTNPLRALRALARAALAVVRARRLLGGLRPAAVMGAGGTLPVPSAWPRPRAASRSCSPRPTATSGCHHAGPARSHGGSASPSRSNGMRLRPRYRVTGRPVPATGVAPDRDAARREFGVAADATCVLVFGGSLGARSINLAALEVFAPGDIHVLHVTGRRDYPQLSARPLRAGYELLEYLDSDRFAGALAAADLVVARAGGSIFEVAAAGRPAVLIPYPHASGDHQTANARWMADAGGAVVIPDRELTAERLAATAGEILADRDRLRAMASASAGLARPHAARDIAAELLAAAS